MSIYSETIGCGKELLLIHGIMSDHMFFKKLVSELEEDHKLILYDRIGYGASSAEDTSDYSVDAQADAAACVIRKHAKGSVLIIAHSAGGMVALETARKYPELVSGIILIETPVCTADVDKERMQKWNEELNVYAEKNKPIKAIQAFHREIGSDGKNKPQEKVTADALKRIMNNLNAFMFGELNYIQSYQPTIEELKALRVPIKMFITDGNPQAIYTQAAFNTAQAAGWEIYHIAGVHNSIEYNVDEFVAKLKTLE